MCSAAKLGQNGFQSVAPLYLSYLTRVYLGSTRSLVKFASRFVQPVYCGSFSHPHSVQCMARCLCPFGGPHIVLHMVMAPYRASSFHKVP